ncbi:MAG: S8 family peptidase, partial [Cytophaga sp.]
ATVVHCSKKVYKAQLDKSISLELVLFNKKNETIVIEPVSNGKHKMIFFDQNTSKVKKGLIKIRRTKNAARTTAVADEFMTLEIIWE